MSYAQFLKKLYSFRSLIGKFWPGLVVESGNTVVLENGKIIRYDDEFSPSADPNNDERVIVSIDSIDGGTF